MDSIRQRGQRKTQDPCLKCFLHRALCICAEIPQLTLKTKLCLVVHAKELKRTTNTGRLAVHALTNSEMFVRGLQDSPLDLTSVVADSRFQTVLFYPAAEAEDLQDFIARRASENSLALPVRGQSVEDRPLQLIVPDGNWRQASKVAIRHTELLHVPRVMIRATNTATQHLRAESTLEGMATLQAIAEAMGVIEGAEIRSALMALYQAKLTATLVGRGHRPALATES